MKKLSDKNFDDLFKERFQNFEIAPPSYLKEKIGRSVNSKQGNSNFSDLISGNKWLLSGIAFVIITGIVAFISFDNGGNINKGISTNISDVNLNQNIIVEDLNNEQVLISDNSKINNANNTISHNEILTSEDNSNIITETVQPEDKSAKIILSPKAGNDASICGLNHKLNASLSSDLSKGKWIANGPGNIVFSNPNDPKAKVSVSKYGSYTLEWIEEYNDLKAQDEIVLHFTKSGEMMLETAVSNCTCNNSDGAIQVLVAGSNENYLYYWQDELKPSESHRDNLAAGNYTITVVDDNNCSVSTSVSLGKIGIPKSSFTHQELTLTVQVPVYFINNTKIDNIIYAKVNNVQFIWDFGDGSSSTTSDPDHSFSDNGEYRVKLTTISSYGCVDSCYTIININNGNNFPDVFTPNGDGINDVFLVKIKTLNNFKATIMNRFGQELFVWNDQDQGWDGKLSDGSYAATGTYYYMISGEDISGKIFQYKGFFLLNR
ncbi:MAG: gliding motility-associated C-terminal domain-containing protein [Bacteroidota bacterium]